MAINKNRCGSFTVDYRDKTGKRFRKTFARKKDARAFNAIVKGNIQTGDFIQPSSATVEDCAREWLKYKVDANSYRPATLQNWRTHIAKYITPLLGSMRIQQVSVAQIEDSALAWTRATSAYTANCCLKTLAAIFKLAIRRGPLQGKSNAAALAQRIKLSNEQKTDGAVLPEYIYGADELMKLVAATEPGSLARCLVMTPMLLGIRRGETVGLTWPCIDFKNNKVHIRNTLVDLEKGRGLRDPKSVSGRRSIDLPKELAKELRVWRLKCPLSEQSLSFVTPSANHCTARRYRKFLTPPSRQQALND